MAIRVINGTVKLEELTIQLHAGGCEFDTVTAGETTLAVTFTYDPGTPERWGSTMEDAAPAEPAQLDIQAIKTIDEMEFFDHGLRLIIAPGYDIIGTFTGRQLAAFEDDLFNRIKKGEFNND